MGAGPSQRSACPTAVNMELVRTRSDEERRRRRQLEQHTTSLVQQTASTSRELAATHREIAKLRAGSGSGSVRQMNPLDEHLAELAGNDPRSGRYRDEEDQRINKRIDDDIDASVQREERRKTRRELEAFARRNPQAAARAEEERLDRELKIREEATRRAIEKRKKDAAKKAQDEQRRKDVLCGKVKLPRFHAHFLANASADMRYKDLEEMEEHRSKETVRCVVLGEEDHGNLLHVLFVEGPGRGVEQRIPFEWCEDYKGLMCCRCEALNAAKPRYATEPNGMCAECAYPSEEQVERTAELVEAMETPETRTPPELVARKALQRLAEPEPEPGPELDWSEMGELQSLALRSVGEADEWKNYRQRKSFTATARRGWRSRLGWLSGLEAARKRLMLAALASWHDCKLAFLPPPLPPAGSLLALALIPRPVQGARNRRRHASCSDTG